jgi:NNP family nitrate/nitrite transporter-like MFS transporter
MAARAAGGKYAALAGATGLLALNFWAWSLLPPLASMYTFELGLSPFAISGLLAMPVIVGSAGRIPLGLLTDLYGGRGVFAAVCLLSSIPAIYLAFATTFTELATAAFCLGIAGASFAVGVPFVSAWFPRRQRGFALGVYGMGNVGTAVSGLLTPRLTEHFGRPAAFLTIAAALCAAGILMALWGRNAPGWKPNKGSVKTRLAAAVTWQPTRRLAALYAVTFGAFVAFGIYLPVLLKVVYSLEFADAAARAAGFVLLATITRPAGGWLSDKFSGVMVLRVVLLFAAVLSATVALSPSLMPVGTVAYLLLAAVLGLGNGAVFALIGHLCDDRRIGSVTGIVGAAGGLGGFFPPLVMGASYQVFHSYSVALLLFTATCLLVLPATSSLRRSSV